MIDLPLREPQLPVTIEDGPILLMATLADAQVLAIMQRGASTTQGEDGEDVTTYNLPAEEFSDLFASQFRGLAEGSMPLKIGGEELDIENPAHIASMPLPWKIKATSRIISYAMELPKEVVRN